LNTTQIIGPATCPDLGPGQSWQHTFSIAGIYPYYDRHKPDRKGIVEVSPAATDTLSSLSATETVSITASGFVPFTVTISLSDTVRWTNTDVITHAVNGGLYYYEVYLPLVMKASTSATAEGQP